MNRYKVKYIKDNKTYVAECLAQYDYEVQDYFENMEVLDIDKVEQIPMNPRPLMILFIEIDK